MTTLWKINGIDTYSTYGVGIKRGSYNEIMSPPTPRKRLEHEYTDQNGVDVDTTSPLTYEPRRFNIKVIIAAVDYTAFWTQYNAFIAAIATPSSFSLWVKDIGVTTHLLYEGAKCIDKTRSLRYGKVIVSYEISVLEQNPTNRTYDPN